MKCANPTEAELPDVAAFCEIRLPMGLLGFERTKDYLLISSPVEEPFRWLRVKDNTSLAFLVLEPFVALPEYQPDIPESDVEFLGLSGPEDAILYNIVTLHGEHRATINLKGPVVINRNTGVGKQVILANAAQYSVQHPLPQPEAVV
jgi:flagellar assembly factor FliW